MKHAGGEALDRLEPLLAQLRGIAGLKETPRGVFYRKGRAFLHFHEDTSGLHADLRLDGNEFDRFRVEAEVEQEALHASIRNAISQPILSSRP